MDGLTEAYGKKTGREGHLFGGRKTSERKQGMRSCRSIRDNGDEGKEFFSSMELVESGKFFIQTDSLSVSLLLLPFFCD